MVARGYEQGQRRQGQDPYQQPAAGNKDKKSAKCWNCNCTEHYSKNCPKKKQSLAVVESQEQSSSSSGATGETTLSGFFLSAFEEETELNSFESTLAGVLVTGIDSGTARSVVPAGEIPGHPVERDSETGRVYTSATGERVFDHEKQKILGTVDGTVRGLNMRVAQVQKSLTSVYDVCAAGHRVVFDFDSNKRDLSHAENKLTGERTYFKLRNCVWELESKSTSFRKRKRRTS